MGAARFIVIDGPDLGASFDLPLRGGGLGRGDDNVVVLTDPAVSRAHCRFECRRDRVVLIDDGSRNKTLVNGAEITEHWLEDGDEVAIGKTRLAFVPAEGGLAVLRDSGQLRLTMEVGSSELRHATTGGAEPRARKHLRSVAALADALSTANTREELGRSACEAVRTALEAQRTFLLVTGGGRISPLAAAVGTGDPRGAQLAVGQDLVAKVMSEGKAVALQTDRYLAAAPLRIGDAPVLGLLYVDRSDRAWDEVDLMAVGCLAHLVAAAITNLDLRARLQQENLELVEQQGGTEFVGNSDGARRVLTFVSKVGPSDATVLLTGESGSGKEMVARGVHRASRRAAQAFVAVNCAAMTETLVESELFGHEKGAFTGATERKIGRFEAADKGTLFLDEVGELPLTCQTKFLRVLEERAFERVGGTKTITVDVRVVAATNRDLSQMVARGEFREDLFYRLSVIHTVVPPLRERPDDIVRLAEHFLAKLKRQVARRIRGFSADALGALAAYRWPGNVRELRNAVERAIVLGDGELLELTDLPPDVAVGRATGSATSPPPLSAAVSPTPPLGVRAQAAAQAPARSLKELEREGIIAALAATGGNKAQAATLLEIDRSTLYKKLKDYDLG